MSLFTGTLIDFNEEVSLEKQLGDNWRNAGDTLSYYRSDSGKYYVQAVVANDLTTDTNIRFKQQPSSTASMIALPYTTQ